MAGERSEGFFPGVLTGLVAAGVLVHVWFAVLLGPLRETYADVGEAGRIPGLTLIVVSPAWLWGMPVIAAALVCGLWLKRPRRLGPYVACAVMVATTLAATWVLSQTPLEQLQKDLNTDGPQMQLVPIGP
jgi:hypothetical protein